MKMNKKSAILLFLAPLLLFLAACDKENGPKVKIEIDPDSDLSQYKTFAIMPLPTDLPGIDPGVALSFGRIAKDVIETEISAKGYTGANLTQADFAVNVRGQVVPKIDVNEYGYGHYGPRGWWRTYPYGNVTVHEYKEGTLIVEIYDGSTKKMVWVGWVTGRRKSGNPDPERFRELLGRIIAPFPGGA